ncbi:hypothetical protein [Chlamydia vaughanii]|uniref:hypothetical protein n=1 Tax=Chlamydia vaughanii TaxID=3112552 RepID=UPI0039F45F10
MRVSRGGSLPPPQRPETPSKVIKIASVISGIIAISLIIVGALGLAGGASIGLLAAGGVALGLAVVVIISSVVKGIRDKKKPQFQPRDEVPLPDFEEEEKIEHQEDYPPLTLEDNERMFKATNSAVNKAKQSLINHGLSNLPLFTWSDTGLTPPKASTLSDSFIFSKVQKHKIYDALGEDSKGYLHYPATPEAMEEFLNLATSLMEASALVADETFTELQDYVSSTPGIRSYFSVLANPMLHFTMTFFCLSENYLFIRFLYENCSEELTDEEKKEAEAQFYTPGTPQHYFRDLYNNFCRRAQLYLGDTSRAGRPDGKELFSYSQQDLGPGFKNPEV